MSFIWLNKQGVRSDTGFELQFTGRFAAEYRESGQVTELYVEGGAGGLLTIYEGSLSGLLASIANPFARKAEKDRLIRNIKEALAFQGLTLDLAAGPAPSF